MDADLGKLSDWLPLAEIKDFLAGKSEIVFFVDDTGNITCSVKE